MGWLENAARIGTAVTTGGLSEIERMARGNDSFAKRVENAPGELWSGATEALTGKKATQSAIDAQAAATRDANATQKYMYDTTRGDLAPWREAGGRALSDLTGNADFQRYFTMADYQADPGYAFRMAEGQKAIERSAAARGGLNSTATLKNLARFNQNLASEEYQNAYNRFNADRDRRFGRLSSIAGIGQTATGQLVNAGQNYGNNVSQNQIGMGNAVASANIAQANRNAGLLGQAITGGAIAFSDRRLKKDVAPIASIEDLWEMQRHLLPYKFKYIDEKYGKGEWIGVMAQDLEKSKLGKTIVVEDENGNKQIDLAKAVSLLLAVIAGGKHAD